MSTPAHATEQYYIPYNYSMQAYYGCSWHPGVSDVVVISESTGTAYSDGTYVCVVWPSTWGGESWQMIGYLVTSGGNVDFEAYAVN
jgi:hypothetical protein